MEENRITISEAVGLRAVRPDVDEAASLQQIITELSPLSPDSRRRIIQTVCTFFELDLRPPRPSAEPALPPSSNLKERSPSFQFSRPDAPTPKQFLLEKSPVTDVERVTCLAYYLTHFREMPHFKTKDITQLNTESAQRPFSNTAMAVDNATKSGYLVPSVKGSKQLSAAGEQFVEALPDRVAAKETLERFGRRRPQRRSEPRLPRM